MIATEHTQSLTPFRAKISQTLDRVNQTGEAEIITVNGEARGVLLSPAAYDQLARDAHLSRETALMRRAMREIEDGKGLNARAAFDEIHAALLEMRKAGMGTGK